MIQISINLYDDSLLKKLSYWTDSTEISVFNVEESKRLIEVIANKTNDKTIKLPIIAIRRPSGFTITNPNKKPMTFDGLDIVDATQQYRELRGLYYNGDMSFNEFKAKSDALVKEHGITKLSALNAIPIRINYTLDVYTRRQLENDLIMRNLIFNIINYPTLKISIDYNSQHYEHFGNLYIEQNVNNGSSEIQIANDQICKQSLQIYMDDAYLWDTRLSDMVLLTDSLLEIENNIGKNDFTKEYLQIGDRHE